MSGTFKKYFKSTFEKKKVITKAIILAIAFVLVLIPSISFYYWLHEKPTGTEINKNSFWYVQVQWNSGIAFSALDNKPGVIYAIQAIVFVILLAVLWLFVQDKISGSFVSCAICGGLFNLIQRAAEKGEHANKVLDYFKFGFWDNFAVFNWPDMFVVIGIFGFIISYIVYIVLSNKDEKSKEQEIKLVPAEEQPKVKDTPVGSEQTPIIPTASTVGA